MRIHLGVEGTLIPRYEKIQACPGMKFDPVRKAALAKMLALRERGIGFSLTTMLPRKTLAEIRVRQLLLDLDLREEDVASALTYEKCAVVSPDPKKTYFFRMFKNHEPCPIEPNTGERPAVTVEHYNYGSDFGRDFLKDEPKAAFSFVNRPGLFGLPFPSPAGQLPLATIFIPMLDSFKTLAPARQNHALELAGRIAELVLGRSFLFPWEPEAVTQMDFEGNRVLHLETNFHLRPLASRYDFEYLPESLQGNVRNWQANGEPRQHFLVYIPERDG